MAYAFPTSPAKARDGAADIIDKAMAAGLLTHAAKLQAIEYENGIGRVSPAEAQNTARGTLDSINARTTQHYAELMGLGLAEYGEQPPLDLLGKINLDIFQTYQIGAQIDDLTGKGYTAEFVDDITIAWGTTGEKVLAGASKIADVTTNTVTSIIDSLRSLGWVALVILVVLAAGVAYSLSKGKIPGVLKP
jgi:hypothetical protein